MNMNANFLFFLKKYYLSDFPRYQKTYPGKVRYPSKSMLLLLCSMLFLCACGLRGKLEKPPPLWEKRKETTNYFFSKNPSILDYIVEAHVYHHINYPTKIELIKAGLIRLEKQIILS